MKIVHIILTGAGCSGKSKMLSILATELSRYGYITYKIPEIASVLMSEGETYEDNAFRFQQQVFERQKLAEDRIINEIQSSKPDRPCVIIGDRGLLDGSAYTASQEWSSLLYQNGITELDIALKYDLVFHLESTALSTTIPYDKRGNNFRREDQTEAVQLDKRLTAIYSSCFSPDRYVRIGVTDMFEQKVDLVLKQLLDKLPSILQ